MRHVVASCVSPGTAGGSAGSEQGQSAGWCPAPAPCVPLRCHDFVDNQVRLQLFVLAYNLGNFLRRLALPKSVKHWSLTTLRETRIKIGAKVVTHARYVIFQMAEVAVPRRLFVAILDRIRRAAALLPRAPVPS